MKKIIGICFLLALVGGFCWGILRILPNKTIFGEISKGQVAVLEDSIQNSDKTWQEIRLDQPEEGSYTKIEFRFYYNRLNEKEKDLYQSLLKNVLIISQEQDQEGRYFVRETCLSQELKREEVQHAVEALLYDNPQFFWLANTYAHTSGGGSTIVQLYSNISAELCSSMSAELNESVAKMLNDFPKEASELDREIFLFKKITEQCRYDYTAGQNGETWKAYTAYGALVEGKAVCDGYARAMQLLCQYADLNCLLVDGMADGDYHRWNLILIDGDWYHLDITWCDADTMLQYNYFNLTDDIIQKDHQITSEGLPECNATTNNYFQAKGIQVSGFSEEQLQELSQRLTERAKNGEQFPALLIAENLDYRETVDLLFRKSPYYFVECLGRIQEETEGEIKIDTGDILYSEAEWLHGVSLKWNLKS